MRPMPAIPSSLLIITTTGFAAAVAQIIIIRELLVLFYGNELSAGLIFTGWLLWSGLGSGLSRKWALKVQSHTALLRLMLVFLAAALPLLVLFIRATRIIGLLPSGELPSIGQMLLLSVVVTGLFCPVSGVLFGICWAKYRKTRGDRPLVIYLGEALGAATGGLVFYLVFLSFDTAFSAIWITSGMILLLSGWLYRPWWPVSQMRLGHLTWMLVAILVASGALFGSDLERRSRRWQWGPEHLAVYDTAYHNIAVLKKANQVSVFANGLWSFSEPDRLSAEHNAHLPLLQHPNPKRILLLGGGVAGLLEELFKQPGIASVDYVEPDPELIDLLKPHLSAPTHRSLQQPHLRLFHEDPRIFMYRSDTRYDLILMSMGDPITAQMNRFYTLEFFIKVKQHLLPGGIFSFAVSGGESMLGPSQIRFLGSLNNTLLQIFPETLIYPGDQIRFFATSESGGLLSDPAALAERISQRKLQLAYLREDTLADALSPFRLGYLATILTRSDRAAVNRDFVPICYFHNLMIWAAQWHAVLRQGFDILVNLKLHYFWTLLIFAGGVIVSIFWTGRCKYRLALRGSVFSTGAIMMVLQVIILLSFQIMAGFMYRQLALIIAFFMTGLAIGAGWISRWRPAVPKASLAQGLFLRVQILVCVLPLGLMLILQLIHNQSQHFYAPAVISWLFSGLSVTTGILGGVHFGVSVTVTAGIGGVLEKIGGELYALDLAGAAVGVLLATIFILPLYGIMSTLIVLSGVSGTCVLILIRRS